jgi:methyltransferase family protein
LKELKIPTTKPELKSLILEALKQSYTSVSGMDNVETGNRYQAVTLGDERTPGFRSGREAFLDRFDFSGKRVLDLGANLGEISRCARNRGAAMVDAFEYDPFFVEIAQMVNAYNGTSRVSFYQRDITDPSIYGEHYDIVIAFSVFIYIQGVLQHLAEITDGVLLLETHRLSSNLESTYLTPVGRLFPHHVILGASEWGNGSNPDGQRAVIAFAKSDAALRAHIPGLGSPGLHFRAGRQRGTQADMRSIDVGRTPWYDRFFKRFERPSVEELLTEIDTMDVAVDELVENGDLASNDLAGWVYWLVYLKGALQAQREPIGGANVYYALLERHWKNDPGRAKDLTDPERLSALVSRRFHDFDLFRAGPDAMRKTAPIQLVVTDGPPAAVANRGVKRVYEAGNEVPIESSVIDGYHRLFLARLFGHKSIPCDFVAQQDALLDSNA